MDTIKQDPVRIETEREQPDDPAPSERLAERRLFVVGDKAIADPLRPVIEDLPGVRVADIPDEASRLLQANGAGVLVIDMLDEGQARVEPCMESSDPSAVWPGFGLEAAEVVGDLLRAVVEATRSARPRKTG